MRSLQQRVKDMLHAIGRIERYSGRGRAAFERDELLQVYLVHHLTILGEAAYKLPHSFRGQHPDVPWDGIIGTRHILVHDYFRIDMDVVWQVIEEDLPALKKQLQDILEGMSA